MEGEYTWPDGVLLYTGDWVWNGLEDFSVEGEYTWPDGVLLYTGDWVRSGLGDFVVEGEHHLTTSNDKAALACVHYVVVVVV